jgi:hypothetical protein
MKNKLLKRCTIVLISALAFFAFHALVQGCAFGGYEYEEAGYTIFNQNLLGPSTYTPFLFDPSQPYYVDSALALSGKKLSGNDQEWAEYLGKETTLKDVDRLVYKSKLAELTELKKAVLNQGFSLNDTLKGNRGVRYLIDRADLSAVDYLILAKRCEPYATAGLSDWTSAPVLDTVVMIKLSQVAEAAASKESNVFVRSRYAYQAARLSHYAGSYARCVELCKVFGSSAPTDSYVFRQFCNLKAGALKHLHKNAEARYQFAMLFDKYYPSEFDFYYQNYAYSTPVKWGYDHWDGFAAAVANLTDSLSGYQYCKTPHEQSVLFFLDAYSGSKLELDALNRIYACEPTSEYLDILVARILTEMEKSGYFPKQAWTKGGSGFTYTKASPIEVFSFVKMVLEKGKAKKTAFWEYTAGHLCYMKKEYANARLYFAKALADDPSSKPLAHQVKAIQILMDLESAIKLDDRFEDKEVEDLKWLASSFPNDDRQRYLYELMAKRYMKQADTIRAILCFSGSANPINLYANPESQPLQGLIDWVSKTNKSPFEALLLQQFGDRFPLENLHELKGTVYLRQNRLKEAAAEYAKAGKLVALPADPFLMRLVDCHDCDFAAKKGQVYTKCTFVQKLMELESASNLSGPDQANAAYLAGNGYYNMTYYGNTWMSLAYFRSTYDAADQFYDCSVAAYFYAKARKLSTDPEFQARCVFMESKCEHNAFYTSMGPGYTTSIHDLKATEHHLNDKLLIGLYKDTRFYKEAIEECSYLRHYSNQ